MYVHLIPAYRWTSGFSIQDTWGFDRTVDSSSETTGEIGQVACREGLLDLLSILPITYDKIHRF
jgi:hypothetical protein